MRISVKLGLVAVAMSMAAGLFAVPASAQAADAARTGSAGSRQAAQGSAGRSVYAHWSVSRGVDYGNPITYKWTVYNTDLYRAGKIATVVTKIPADAVETIRFTGYPPGPRKCGYYRESDDDGDLWWVIYCIQNRPERWRWFSFSFKVWPTDEYDTIYSYHYWDIFRPRGTIASDVDVASGNYIGRSRTDISY